MNTLPDQSWIDDVILHNPQHSEEQQHQKSVERTGVKHREDSRDDCDSEWSNQGNEFERACQHPHDQPARQSEQGKGNCANDSDKQARGQLRTNIRCQRAVNVLEELVATPTPTSSWKHQQGRTAKTLRVLQ